MATPASYPWLKVTTYISGYVKEASNEFWFFGAGAALPTNYDPTMTATAAYAYLTPILTPLMSAQTSIIGCAIESNFSMGTFGSSTYQTTAGTVAGISLPEDVAVVVRKESLTPGKSTTGRWRFTSIPETFSNGSYLSTTGTTAFNTQVPLLLSSFVDQGVNWFPSIYSRKLSLLTEISSLSTDGLLGTNRRRRPRF